MIFVIGGPTASGKTDLAIQLAKAVRGHIINADAFQVYRGMDIGTNKDLSIFKGIPTHLFDIREPNQSFSVKDYQSLCRPILDQLQKQKIPAILVGGTGLFIKATLYDFVFPEERLTEPSNLATWSDDDLYRYLKSIDPMAALKIHPNNRRRLMRAIAIFQSTGMAKTDHESLQSQTMLYPASIVALDPERQALYDAINARVQRQFERGLVAEVRALSARFGTEIRAFQGIGYKEVLGHLSGMSDVGTAIAEVQMATRRYAKRQWTYFKHQLPTRWFKTPEEALAFLKDQYEHARP